MFLRRLIDVRKKTSFLRCIWDVLQTSQKGRLFWDVSEKSLWCLSQRKSDWVLSETSHAGWNFQKDVAEYIVVIHCIIVSFWNLNHSHSLSLVVPLVVIRCTTHCHLLSFIVTLCHSLYYSLSFVVLLVVTSCHSLYDSLSFVFTRCTTHLSFCKRSYSRCQVLCVFVLTN